MKFKILLLGMLFLLTGCAYQESVDAPVEINYFMSGFLLLTALLASTPKLMHILFFFFSNKGERMKDSLEEDMILKKIGADRSQLSSYQIANSILISVILVPIFQWLLVLCHVNAILAGLISFVVGFFLSTIIGKSVFLYSGKLRPVSIIMRLAMLLIAVVFFIVGP